MEGADMNLTAKSSEDVRNEHLEWLINSRDLNKSQMSKVLEVEAWTIGAWLSGKREISSKYKEKIFSLLKLPKTADLLIAPAVNQLSKKIADVEDATELQHVTTALENVLRIIGRKLSNSCLQSINTKTIIAFKEALKPYDDYSIMQLNKFIASLVQERGLISTISNEAYATQCIKHFENNKYLDNLLIELEKDQLTVTYFSESYEPSSFLIRDAQGEVNLSSEEQNDFFEECIIDDAKKLFAYTSFEEETTNRQWGSAETYLVIYSIPLTHPQFKESLRMLINRCTKETSNWQY